MKIQARERQPGVQRSTKEKKHRWISSRGKRASGAQKNANIKEETRKKEPIDHQLKRRAASRDQLKRKREEGNT